VRHLTSQIQSGHLRVGERLPTFIQLQQQFGMTSPTVNRAMIALEQQGLVERKRGSGVYVSNGKNMKRPRHSIIGLAGFGFQFGGRSSYWTTLLEGIREEAARHEAQIMLLEWNSPVGWEKADGVLICDWSSQFTLRHVPPSLPCVSVMVEVEGMASVVADDYAATLAATRHLLDLGHRRIAFLHGPAKSATARRLGAYRDALREKGIKPLKGWERLLAWEKEPENFVRAGEEIMGRWLKDDWNKIGCTALLCQNDATAVGAAAALSGAGIKVPNDVSLVGFDGSEIGEYSSPRLTTVEVPLREIGARAVEILSRQIEADQVSIEHQILPTQLRVRESTTAPSHHL